MDKLNLQDLYQVLIKSLTGGWQEKRSDIKFWAMIKNSGISNFYKFIS